MTSSAYDSPLADLAPPHTVEPVTAAAERPRQELRAALCDVGELSGALWMAVAIAPENDAVLDALDGEFRKTVLRALLAFDHFKTARSCAGSA